MSWDVPRVSPHTAQAKPSGRTLNASDWALAGDGDTTTDAGAAVQVVPAGRRRARICAGVVRPSTQAAIKLPAPSTPMRAFVCAVVPGSSEIFSLAAHDRPPLVRLEKKMSAFPLRESCQTAY